MLYEVRRQKNLAFLFPLQEFFLYFWKLQLKNLFASYISLFPSLKPIHEQVQELLNPIKLSTEPHFLLLKQNFHAHIFQLQLILFDSRSKLPFHNN
jgi:hypothetical protein